MRRLALLLPFVLAACPGRSTVGAPPAPERVAYDLVIERGERVPLLGANGTGKSTIMRLAADELSPQTGTVRPGSNVTLAYQDQQLGRLDDSKTVLAEAMDATGFDAPEARDLLGRRGGQPAAHAGGAAL